MARRWKWRSPRWLWSVIGFCFTLNVAADDATCLCEENLPTYSLDQILACYSDTRCEDEKKHIEVTMRAKAKSLVEAMEHYMQLANNPIFSHDERKAYLSNFERGRIQIKSVKKLIDFPGYDQLMEPLYVDFDYPEKGYHRHYYSFNIGYEYVSLNSIFQQGFPRIGFLIYRRYGDTPVMIDGLGYYGLHFSGGLQLTSSGELANKDATKTAQNTLQLTADMYVPFFHSLLRYDGTFSDYVGVLFSYDAKKTEADEQAQSRFYTGFRNAINPETYVDVLTGISGTVTNNRMEIRTQLPVYKFETGSRIFFGAIINIAAPWGRTTTAQDVMRFYLHWNADFGKILEGISSAVGL